MSKLFQCVLIGIGTTVLSFFVFRLPLGIAMCGGLAGLTVSWLSMGTRERSKRPMIGRIPSAVRILVISVLFGIVLAALNFFVARAPIGNAVGDGIGGAMGFWLAMGLRALFLRDKAA